MATKKKGAKKPQQARKRPAKRRIKLMVISEEEAKEHAVFEYAGEGTVVMSGDAPTNVVMECGSCGAPLLKNVPVQSIQGIVFRCKKCRALNESLA
jgi:hypothetical protein